MMNQQSSSVTWWQRPQPVWISTLLSTLILLTLFALWNVAQTVWATEENLTEINTTTSGLMPYQGFLTNKAGEPLDGSQTISFALYNMSTGGTMVWGPETHTDIPVNNGLFNVSLGSKTIDGINSSVWNYSPLYIQVSINGEPLSPREPVVAPKQSLQLLGVKTADPDIEPSELVDAGWTAVKGANSQDAIHITTTTQGGPVFVSMAARYTTTAGEPPLSNLACAIYVYDEAEQFVTRAMLESNIGSTMSTFACSGSYLFDLPAGTYKFQAEGYTPNARTISWTRHRQIAVFEYR